MPGETDAADRTDDSSDQETDRIILDRALLSDLSVNGIPIGILVALTAVVVVFSPGGAGDSVLLFHAALIGGVVLVSVVAGVAIRRLGSPLEGSAGRSYDAESDRE